MTMGDLIFRFRRRAVEPNVLTEALRRTGPIAYGSATYQMAWGDESGEFARIPGRLPNAQPACAVPAPKEAYEAAEEAKKPASGP